MSNDDTSRQNSATAGGAGTRSSRDALAEAGLVPRHERISVLRAALAVSCDQQGKPCTACRLGGYCAAFDRRSRRAFLAAGVLLLFVPLSLLFGYMALAEYTAATTVFGTVRPLGPLDSAMRYSAVSHAVAGVGWLAWLWSSGWLTVLRRRMLRWRFDGGSAS